MCVASGLAAFSVPGYSQEPEALEEVLVTARRQAESLQSLAVSGTVFDAEYLARARVLGVEDYALMTPNLELNETGTRSENSLAIRGVSNIGAGLNSSLAVYVDELNVLPLVPNPQLQDIERVEVLRGPQGTFFGRNAAAGAINISTVRPSDTLEGNLFFEGSSFSTYQAGATLNVPLGDSLAIRGTAYVYESDGWIDNSNSAGGSNDQSHFGGRIAARFTPTERLTIDVSISSADESNGLESGVPTGKLSVGSIGLWGLNAIQEVPPFPKNRDRVNNDNPKEIDYDYNLFNGRIQYEFDDFVFTSVTGAAEGGRKQDGDVDATSFDAVNLTRDQEIEFNSQEFRLAFNPSSGISWTVGASWYDQEFKSDLEVILGSFNPFGAPDGTLIRAENGANDLESWALFGEVDIPIGDKLMFTYGGRYSDDHVSAQQVIVNGTPMGPVVNDIPEVSQNFTNYSNKFALTYDSSENLSFYVLASQGYRAGGVQLDPALAGVKGLFLDGRLRFAAAVFHVDWEDLQVRSLVNAVNPQTGEFTLVTGVDNAAEAASTGIELEIEALATDKLRLGFALGYMHAEYEDYQDAVIDGAVALIDLSGEQLLDAPELNWSLFAEYNFTVGDHWEGFVRGEYSYVDEKVTNHLAYVPPTLFPVPFDFSFPYSIPDFEVVNLRIGMSREHYSVYLFAENVFDENYYTGTFDDLFASGIHVRTHPREVGARITYNF
jgi:iron complex outermembrane receptor protein